MCNLSAGDRSSTSALEKNPNDEARITNDLWVDTALVTEVIIQVRWTSLVHLGQVKKRFFEIVGGFREGRKKLAADDTELRPVASAVGDLGWGKEEVSLGGAETRGRREG